MQEASSLATQSSEDSARDRLLNAGLEAFAKHGFEATTTRDIASAAGMSPAGLYIHFRSKEELLVTLMTTGLQRLLKRIDDAASSAQGPSDKLRAVVAAHVCFHAEEATYALVSNYGIHTLPPEQRAPLIRLRDAVESYFDQPLAEGEASGEFVVDDRRMTAFFILSAGIGVARWYSPGGPLTPQQLADEYAELAMRAVRPWSVKPRTGGA